MSQTYKMNNMVQMFKSLTTEQSLIAGGKGASLACLYQNGYPVPTGFIILPNAFIDDELLPDAKEKVREYLEIIRSENLSCSFAVRSSALSEDSMKASFAGEFETKLNVSSDDDVFSATRFVRNSRKSERVKSYSKEKGIEAEHEMAIVIQLMVQADVSGVLFTANPINGQRDQTVINASWGLGESVVSGTVTPDTFIINNRNNRIIKKEMGSKETNVVSTNRDTECNPTSKQTKIKITLINSKIIEITKLANKTKDFFGLPLDIEWTLADGKFAIVQARPITTLPDAGYSWKLSKGMYAVMRNNIVEMMPNPLTPLFSTLGRTYVNKGMNKAMDTFIGKKNAMPEEIIITVNKYAYYNGSINFGQIVKILLGTAGIMKRMFSGTVERWTEEFRPRYLKSIEQCQQQELSEQSTKELLEAVREMTSLAVEAYTTLVSGIIPAAWMTEGLFTLYYKTMIKTKRDPNAPIYLLGFDSKPIKAEKALYDLAQWINEVGLNAYILNTSAEQIVSDLEGKTPSATIETDVWQGWKNRMHDYLKQYGDIIYDLDFGISVPSDNPEPQIETLKFFLGEDAVDPYERQASSIKCRKQAEEGVEKRLRRGLRLKGFKKYLNLAQKYAPLRENGLSEVGLDYPILRKMLKEVGQRFVNQGIIEKADDIFWLYESEVESVIKEDNGDTAKLLAPVVSTRKESLANTKRIAPPQILPQIKFSKEKSTGNQRINKKAIKGVAASSGQVTAKACIIHGPEEFSKMITGCVLVAPITTPAWTPLFARASAIVTDIGGPLSHGSIVAREYGIPAVLGTGDATTRIREGQVITVNGSKGIVKIEQ